MAAEHVSASGGFWDALPEPDRLALRAVAHMRTFARGATLCYEGDPSDHVLLIEDGWVKVFSTAADGHETILAVRGPGDLVGEQAGLSGQPRTATVAALDRVRTLIVTVERFRALLDASPRASRILVEQMSARLSEIGRRLLSNPSTSGGQRLARLLLDLAERHGVATDGGLTITLPMSQQELASWVDTSRETAARALKDWRARGLVGTARCRITVIDVPGLSKIASSGPADGVPPSAGRRSSYD